MKITKVNYGKTYSLGNYCSERIDLEASIDETQESVTDAVFQLREYCDQLHKKNNPQLYTETTVYNHNDDFPSVEPKDQTPKDESLAKQINLSNEVTVVKSFELRAKNIGGKAMKAYLEKINTPVVDVKYETVYRDGGTKEYVSQDGNGTRYFIWIKDRKVYKDDFPPNNTTPEHVLLNVIKD